MNAKTQLQSRGYAGYRTSVSDLTRLRMNAFAQHTFEQSDKITRW